MHLGDGAGVGLRVKTALKCVAANSEGFGSGMFGSKGSITMILFSCTSRAQPAALQRHLLLQNAEFMNPAHVNVNTSLGHTSVAYGISKLKVASCKP